MKKIYLLFTGILCAQTISAQVCYDTGSGVDGLFELSSNLTIPSGQYNFTDFILNTGATLTFTGNAPLEIYCTGSATIHGTISVAGQNGTSGVTFSNAGVGGIGVAGGGNGGDGVYSSSVGQLPGNAGLYTGGGMGGINWAGGAGAGFSTDGGTTGMAGMTGGVAYGNAALTVLEGGSGGGGGSGGFSCGSGGGGAGGGAMIIVAPSITISATGVINANGGDGGSDGNGSCGGGGAGSGGAIILFAETISNDGMVIAEGGSGGASPNVGAPYYGVGGNGADGRILFKYANYTGTGLISPLPSNLSVPTPVYYSQAVTLCEGETITVGSNTYDSDGTYTDVLVAANTCDSTVTTTVTTVTIDNTLSYNDPTLVSNQAMAAYQWLDCNNSMQAIPMETAQGYTPAVSGNYAVEVTMDGCVEVSECMLVDYTGIEELIGNSKKLVKITDLMGRETTFQRNTPLILIYDDGSVLRVFETEK